MTSAAFRPEEGLALADVAREIPGAVEIVGESTTRVFGVHHDSRRITAGDLFVARKGEKSDGTRFIPQAKAAGASAVLARRGDIDATTIGLPALLVEDTPIALAHAAAAVYGHPTFSLEVVGITGTNGKTTCAHLTRAAIGSSVCGIVGTVGHVFRDLFIDASHTTPEADELARVMATMRKRGATHVAMEVSSIALSLGRVRAVRFRVAAFTNLTQDHLDFHGTMDDYARAKEKLFFEMAPGSAVINVDDALGSSMAARIRAPLVRVGTKDADVFPREATLSARGIDALLHTPSGEHRVRSRLVGRHNLENILVAVGIAAALDLDLAHACEAIGAEGGAPGRLERCDDDGDDITVLVDYAHTPDALIRVLSSVRSVSEGRRLVCIFGCGGDRDPKKRAPMGRAVAEGADLGILTNDNPRTEDPEAIARQVEVGLREGARARQVDGGGSYRLELDRAAAIRDTILNARPGDVIVICGKGHEDYQIIGTEKLPFDDREHARKALSERRG